MNVLSTSTTPANLPRTKSTISHMAYHVSEEVGGRILWKQIGIVWPHRDQQGGTIYVNRLPENGRIVFRSVNQANG